MDSYDCFTVKQSLLPNYSKFTKNYYGNMLHYGKYTINCKAFVIGVMLELYIRSKEILQ